MHLVVTFQYNWVFHLHHYLSTKSSGLQPIYHFTLKCGSASFYAHTSALKPALPPYPQSNSVGNAVLPSLGFTPVFIWSVTAVSWFLPKLPLQMLQGSQGAWKYWWIDLSSPGAAWWERSSGCGMLRPHPLAQNECQRWRCQHGNECRWWRRWWRTS